MTTTVTNWSLDYEQLPGCRLNLNAFRFFGVHPNETGTYVLSHPGRGGILVRGGTKTDLTTKVGDFPADLKAVTQPLFTRKKL
jgi:hypothetical protein